MTEKLSFIICTLKYKENGGGVLWLNRLAVRLRDLGHRVRLGAIDQRLWFKSQFKPQVLSGPATRFPVLRFNACVGDSIVVYPEIFPGNPLGAKNVVRWLLNKPGLNSPYIPVPGEMYFKAGDFSDDPDLTGGAPLLSAWQVNPIYANRGYRERSGTCYLMRKGKGRQIVHDLDESICVDGKSHAEMAEVFNRTHTFYCYDEMSLYASYAAICGCLSIVIPGYFQSHEQYVATRRIARYGISYGFDNIQHARSTSHLVAGLLAEMERESEETIFRFIDLTRERFSEPQASAGTKFSR
jgi:hypothetical protein